MKPIHRLEEIKKSKNLRNSDLDRVLKLSNGAYAKAVKNEASLKDESIILLLDYFPDINLYWLLLGRGEMCLEDEEKQVFNPGNTGFLKEKNLLSQIKDLKKDKFFLQTQLEKCMQSVINNQ